MKHTAPTLRRTLLALALAALPLAAAAVDDAAFRAAREQFQRAAGAEPALIDAAAERWQALSRAEPADPLLRGYAGAATALQARATVWPWKKMAHVDDGMAQLDKALAQLGSVHDAALRDAVPASLELRFVAASTFLNLPAMFNRGPRGARLLGEVLASPLLAGTPASFQAQVWLRAGQQAAAEGRKADARRWLEKSLASGTPAAATAQALLGAL